MAAPIVNRMPAAHFYAYAVEFYAEQSTYNDICNWIVESKIACSLLPGGPSVNFKRDYKIYLHERDLSHLLLGWRW